MKKVKWENDAWRQWEDRPQPISSVVKHSLFIATKVPLSTIYERNYRNGEKSNFTVETMQDKLVRKSISAGLVVDATFEERCYLFLDCVCRFCVTRGTRRYYHDTNEWEDWDIQFTKLRPNETAGVRQQVCICYC
jgi:hypothetical protein